MFCKVEHLFKVSLRKNQKYQEYNKYFMNFNSKLPKFIWAIGFYNGMILEISANKFGFSKIQQSCEVPYKLQIVLKLV